MAPRIMNMPEKKTENFTVTDRRLFTAEGELRSETPEEEPSTPGATETPAQPEPSAPQPPSADEQKQQAEAYQKSSQDMDREVELSGHSAKDLEVSFERFLASLYMTGMLQLGLMHEQGGQPQLDLIGARQTIDTISLLADKTKGNLTPKEQNFLQNALYELRMAYVEVTNAIARGPQPVPPSK
ncbi:MAG TPA: DUF1844 domain-containing protein [Terriglobales bacterium]|jgi:hypothetical protein|nr:DUF1844 domain-containing protein [Terriglobales bacterium]